MDRIWQWAWDRYGARYSWAVFAITSLVLLPVWLGLAFLVIAFEQSDRYVEAAAVTVAVVVVMVYLAVLPGVGPSGRMDRWAAGREVDRVKALEATYAWNRQAVVRTVGAAAVWIPVLLVGVGAISRTTAPRLVQYGILGAVLGSVSCLIIIHSFVEATTRPARIAIAGDRRRINACLRPARRGRFVLPVAATDS
jgi:adenylate cyclase